MAVNSSKNISLMVALEVWDLSGWRIIVDVSLLTTIQKIMFKETGDCSSPLEKSMYAGTPNHLLKYDGIEQVPDVPLLSLADE